MKYKHTCINNNKAYCKACHYEETMNDTPEDLCITKKQAKLQSKKHSHYEITVNQVAGIIIGWCIVYFIFPLLQDYTMAEQATISAIMFFKASYTRSYIVRRLFNKLHAKGIL